ncbi:hypothetical protein D3C73_1566940 [compost metagenome]
MWHHAVIGSNNNNNNVSKSRTVLTKSSKGFMARCVEKRNRTIFSNRLIGANVLGNTTGFAIDYLLAKDSVE